MNDVTSAKPAVVVAPAISHTRLWAKIAFGLALLGIAIWVGREFGHHIPALEEWIGAQGIWAYLIFIGAVVVFTSVFVPDTVFAVAAGALFGVFVGTIVMTVGCLLTATLNYLLGRLLFQNLVRDFLANNPRLAAIERAANREGLRFQFMLRLTPINPVTVSYVLGATRATFSTYLVACLGLIPSVAVEVYFGYAAKHIARLSGKSSEHSKLHSALTIVGLLLCVAMLLYIIRLAHRAMAEYAEPAPDAS